MCQSHQKFKLFYGFEISCLLTKYHQSGKSDLLHAKEYIYFNCYEEAYG